MTWMDRYISPSSQAWQGRHDIPDSSCFFQAIKLYDLRHHSPTITLPAFGLIGFACDEGIRRNVGRTGASQGPAAIRDALAKLSLRIPIHCYDAGDITCIDQDLESSQQALAHVTNILLQQNITPIVLGGGHELAYGHYQGIAKTFPTQPLSIVNFDAHFDMRPLLPDNKGSSGTPFLQIAQAQKKHHQPFDYHCLGIQSASNIPLLFETARQHDVKLLLAEEMFDTKKINHFIKNILQTKNSIYTSICLDVFSTAYAPGVSAPQILGITPWQVIPSLRLLAQSGQVISYDLAELSPPYDIDHRTAKLAAHLISDIIHHHQHG